MNYIDTHFHLDLFKDEIVLVDKIEKSKIYTIAVTNAPRVFKHTQQICFDKKYIKPALGYHPEIIPIIDDELSIFEELISETRYIGEVGLDYSDSLPSQIEEQKRIFTHILDLCNKCGGKILTVHSRKAELDVIELIGSNFNGRVILHYYSGSVTALKKAIEYGFYFSVNSSMVKTANGRKIISLIPLNRLLTESDGPFLSIEEEKITPLIINAVIIELAKLLGDSEYNICNLVYNNFKRLLMD